MVVCRIFYVLPMRVYGAVPCAGGLFKQADWMGHLVSTIALGTIRLGTRLDFYGFSMAHTRL